MFQQVSGLAINLQKSEVLTTNVYRNQAEQIALTIGCKLAEFPFMYLGIPLSDRHLPKTAYLDLLTKLNKRLAGWEARFLSIAGRLVLLNSILSSLPIYYMSVLKLPQWVLSEIDKIRRRFLWHGAADQVNGYSLANWDMVCQPKSNGGLGILDLKIFNYALLLKWHWWWFKPEKQIMENIASEHSGRKRLGTRIRSIFGCNGGHQIFL